MCWTQAKVSIPRLHHRITLTVKTKQECGWLIRHFNQAMKFQSGKIIAFSYFIIGQQKCCHEWGAWWENPRRLRADAAALQTNTKHCQCRNHIWLINTCWSWPLISDRRAKDAIFCWFIEQQYIEWEVVVLCGGWMDRLNRQTDRQRDRQIERQRDRQIERQRDRETDR